MKIQNTNSKQNFNAYHIATTKNYLKNIETPIEIYKLTNFDKDFIKHLHNKTDLKSLMPNLEESKLDIWRYIFQFASNQVTEQGKNGLMAVYNNKPCGLMAYTHKPSLKAMVNTICTWPSEVGKKVPYAGKTLFYMMFEDFLKTKNQMIDLDAITNGPFNPVTKYMQLGFKQRGGENGILAMRTRRENVIETMKKLQEIISIEEHSPAVEADLFNILI